MQRSHTFRAFLAPCTENDASFNHVSLFFHPAPGPFKVSGRETFGQHPFFPAKGAFFLEQKEASVPEIATSNLYLRNNARQNKRTDLPHRPPPCAALSPAFHASGSGPISRDPACFSAEGGAFSPAKNCGRFQCSLYSGVNGGNRFFLSVHFMCGNNSGDAPQRSFTPVFFPPHCWYLASSDEEQDGPK